MNCDQALCQISAWIDGELDSTLAGEVENHVRACDNCKEFAEDLRGIDKSLSTEFKATRVASQRVADRTTSMLPLQDAVRADRSSIVWNSTLALLSAAAGFLLAFFSLHGERGIILREIDGPRMTSPAESFASVNFATGPIQIADIASDEFAQVDLHLLEVGTKLRTQNHKSELLTSTGAALRLDANTELRVPSANQAILDTGRLMCYSPVGGAIAVRSCGTTINVTKGSYDIRCVASDEAELIALDGNVQVTGEDWQSSVEAGKKIRLADGKIVGEANVTNPTIATRWIHELIRRKSPKDTEVLQRVDELWASIGFSKMQHLYEEELRMLGSSCVRPLTSFLFSERDEHRSDHRRAKAARLVADVADYESVPHLIELLGDRDLEVSYQMARGLARITGRELVDSSVAWKTAGQGVRDEAVRKWKEWLASRQAVRMSI